MIKKVISIILVLSMLSAMVLPIVSSFAVENVSIIANLNGAPMCTGAATWVEGPDREITVTSSHSTGIESICYSIDDDALITKNSSTCTFTIPEEYFDKKYHDLYIGSYARNGEFNSIIFQIIGPDLTGGTVVDPVDEAYLTIRGLANGIPLVNGATNKLYKNDILTVSVSTNRDISYVAYSIDGNGYTVLNNSFNILNSYFDGNNHTLTLKAVTTEGLEEKKVYTFSTDSDIIDVPEETWLILRAWSRNMPLVNGDPNLLERGETIEVRTQSNDTVRAISYSFDGGTYKTLYNLSDSINVPSNCYDGNYHTITLKGETIDGTIEYLTYRIIILDEDENAPTVKVTIDGKTMNQTDTYVLGENQDFVAKATSTSGIKRMEYRFMQENSKNAYSDNVTVKIPEEYKDGSTYKFSVRAEGENGKVSSWQTYLFRYDVSTNIDYPIIVLPDEKLDTKIDSLIVALRTIPITKKTGNYNYFKVGEDIQYNIDFANGGRDITGKVYIDFVVPSGYDVNFIDTKGGTIIDDNTIRWTFNGLKEDENGTIPIILRYNNIDYSNIVKPYAKIYSGSLSDYSAVVNYIFEDTSTRVITSHEAFMIGDAGTGLFRPNDGINRAEVATVLVRIFDLNLVNGYTNTYSDATKMRNEYGWAEQAILTVTKYGLMEGYDDGEFKAGNKVTKAQLITILARKFAMDGGDSSKNNPFLIKDLPLKWFNNLSLVYNNYGYDSHWASKYLAQMIRLNMLPEFKNTIDGNLDLVISRAEVAKLVSTVLLRGPSIDGTNGDLTRYFPDINSNTPYYEYILEASAYTHNSKFKTNGWETMVR